MKNFILNLNELSDSKEIYNNKPNPFMSFFIYGVIFFIIVFIVFSIFFKIEIVSKSFGVIRPNDSVSTVSSAVGGKIVKINYVNGDFVKKGNTLFVIDSSELKITLDGLVKNKKDYKTKIKMYDKFIKGINEQKNPFNSNINSKEYPYYIQFKNFELLSKSKKEEYNFNFEKIKTNLDILNKQKDDIDRQIDELKKYKKSVKDKKDYLLKNSDYKNMYKLYNSTLNKMKTEYEINKSKIENDNSEESKEYFYKNYKNQIKDYEYLINSIKINDRAFPEDYESIGTLLYENYLNNLDEYRKNYEKSLLTYDFYEKNDLNIDKDRYLGYDKDMLSGYTFFKGSIETGKDIFPEKNNYKNLYIKYLDEYSNLESDLENSNKKYNKVKLEIIEIDNDVNLLKNEIIDINKQIEELSEKDVDKKEELLLVIRKKDDEIRSLIKNKNVLELSRDDLKLEVTKKEQLLKNYKQDTIDNINKTILEVNANLAVKESNSVFNSNDYNKINSKKDVEIRKNELDSYKNKMILEYENILKDLKLKLKEIDFSKKNKEDLLDDLEKSYLTNKNEYYYQTLNNIDSKLDNLSKEYLSVKSNLNLYENDNKYSKNNLDSEGNPIVVSSVKIKEISDLLNLKEQAELEIKNIDIKEKQVKEQIKQCTKIASQSGILNNINEFVVGDILTAGSVIATIIPIDESELKTQIYVKNKDIANIKIGNKIKYDIEALPAKQYGNISGIVKKISKDSLIENGKYSGYYLVEGTIENIEVKDKDGNKGKVDIGMQCVAKIVTQKKTIFRYFMEKIKLF